MNENLNRYLRIKVIYILDCKMKEDFFFVCDCDETVENFAKRLEATKVFEDIGKSKGVFSQMRCTIYQTLIVYLPGVGPLNFQARLGDVLAFDDLLEVHSSKLFSESPLFDNGTNVISERLADFEKEQCLLRGKTDSWFDDIDELSEDGLLLLHLYNKNALKFLHQFCSSNFGLEFVLLWLEIKIFRDNFSIAEGTSSKDKLHYFQGDAFERASIHARYISAIFLTEFSANFVNIPRYILDTVGWPVPETDALTNLPKPIYRNIFDCIKAHVFLCISNCIFPKYLNSESYQNFKRYYKEHRADLMEGRILEGQHNQAFNRDVEALKDILCESLKFQRNILYNNFDLLDPTGLSKERDTMNLSATLSANNVTSSQANRNNDRLSPHLSPKIEKAKKTRIRTEKKLYEFFGDFPPPESDDYFADALILHFSPNIKYKFSDIDKSSISLSALSNSSRRTSSLSVLDDKRKFMMNRRKAEKLGKFFGVKKLPKQQLLEQNLLKEDSRSDISLLEEKKPPTNNELRAKDRRRMVSSVRKLMNITGQVPDEDVLASLLSCKLNNLERRSVDATSFITKSSKSDSNNSLVSSLENISLPDGDRAKARRKIAKLQKFLGEVVTPEMINNEKSDLSEHLSTKHTNYVGNLSSIVRKNQVRRSNKLNKVFGEIPPSHLIADCDKTADEDSEFDSLDKSPHNLVLELLENGRNADLLIDLLEELGELDDDELPRRASSDSLLRRERLEKTRSPSQQSASSTSSGIRLVRKVELARKRNRISKLVKFFGSSAGLINEQMDVDDKITEGFNRNMYKVAKPGTVKTIADRLNAQTGGNESE